MCESKDYRVNRASFANGVLKNMLSTRRLSNAILFSVYFLAFILRQRHIKTNAETIFGKPREEIRTMKPNFDH